jgi:COG4 transport protein
MLNEIAVLLARWNLYIKFLAVKCQVFTCTKATDVSTMSLVLKSPLSY